MAQAPATVDDERSRSSTANTHISEGGAGMVFVLRCHELEEGKGMLHYLSGEFISLTTAHQREFELNYDHLDQRHGPALSAPSL